jgi:ankyrin repeat protein
VLLDAGADAATVSYDGGVCIHLAAMQGHAAITELLLAHGATAVMDTLVSMCECCGFVTALMQAKQPAGESTCTTTSTNRTLDSDYLHRDAAG